VPVLLSVRSVPRKGGAGRTPVAGDEEGSGGILAELHERHSRSFRSTWELQLGTLQLVIDSSRQLDALEALWVFLLDLVDVGYGEWSLYDGRDTLVIEAQVFGPDIQLELAGESGSPRFKGQRLPGRALVRLARFVEQGAGAVATVLEQQCGADAEFAAHPERAGFEQELRDLRAAVAGLPLEFRDRKAHSSGTGASAAGEVC
jgi:hypothetical protein